MNTAASATLYPLGALRPKFHMNLEYLDATGNGRYLDPYPKYLIRLSGYSEKEKNNLIEDIQSKILNKRQALYFHKLNYINSLNCSLILKLNEVNEGLRQIGNNNEFICLLSFEAFKDMIEIIRNVDNSHNWLTPGDYLDEPAFLISKWGSW